MAKMHIIMCTLLTIAICLPLVFGGELTFELPDNEKQCFFELIDKDVESTLEFQVLTGLLDGEICRVLCVD